MAEVTKKISDHKSIAALLNDINVFVEKLKTCGEFFTNEMRDLYEYISGNIGSVGILDTIIHNKIIYYLSVIKKMNGDLIILREIAKEIYGTSIEEVVMKKNSAGYFRSIFRYGGINIRNVNIIYGTLAAEGGTFYVTDIELEYSDDTKVFDPKRNNYVNALRPPEEYIAKGGVSLKIFLQTEINRLTLSAENIKDHIWTLGGDPLMYYINILDMSSIYSQGINRIKNFAAEIQNKLPRYNIKI